MENLDYSILQPLSANNEANKRNKANDNEICKNELEKYLRNFKEHMLTLSVYDMSSLLIAEQDWIKRYNKNTVYSDSLIGKIIKVDFGKTYLCENGLIHYAICIGECQNKYLVVPMTTSNDEIKIAYHPEFRNTGEKRLYLLKKADGNSKDSALYINDMKFISSGRIIKVYNKISTVAYNNIIHLISEIALSDIDVNIKSLTEENKMLKDKNKLLEENNKLMQLLLKNNNNF